MATKKNELLGSSTTQAASLENTLKDTSTAAASSGTAAAKAATNTANAANYVPTSTNYSRWRTIQQTGKAGTDYNNLLNNGGTGQYQNAYAPAINDALNKILNREAFSYDVNTDGLYQQIKDNYVKQGKQAAMDVQGQSAALSGGYGNSYGVLAGNQAYQEQLTNLSNQIPELYQLAYNRYNNEDTRDRNNLSALQGLEATDYARYQDETSAYDAALQTAYQKYAASRSGGSGKTKQQLYEALQETKGVMDNLNVPWSSYVTDKVGTGEWSPELGKAVTSVMTAADEKTAAEKINGY